MPRVDDMAGETFGKYVVVRRIAVGGMAEVCLARLEGAAGFHKLVVVKQVLPQYAEDPAFVDMFLDEGRVAARLTHPNIAQTFELGQERGRYFMAMEYVPGRSLTDIFARLEARKEELPLACAMRITMQLLEALGYAHAVKDARGQSLELVHRDVSGSNVMVTFDGSVKLLDFGVAKAAAQIHQTRAGHVKGKAGYMSPEQCRGRELDARSDLYSAGALLYQLVTGVRPFEELMNGSDVIAVMQATMRGGFAKPSEVAPTLPGAIDEVVLKAMALKTDDRYANAGAMLRDLERFASAMGVFPSTQKLADLMRQLFPGAVDEVEPPPLPRSTEKPGPPVPTLPELKAVVSAGFAGMVPRASAAPGESGVQTRVHEREEPTTGESGETQRCQEPPSEPEIPTEISGKKTRGLPVGWLVLAFAVAVTVGLIAVTLLAPPPLPTSATTPATQAKPAAPRAERREPELAPSIAAEGTGTVSLDASPAAMVWWGETSFGETPVIFDVPTGEQTFVFRWGQRATRAVRLVVKPAETTTHLEKL